MRPMLLLSLLLALPTLAASAARDPFDLPVERYALPNGLRVLLHRDTTLPQVVVSLWFHVGSRNERPGRTGFAHLYEHLMFMGSRYVPDGSFDRLMEEVGANNNATTSPDATFYYDSGPSHTLPLLLWLEAERLATLPQAMSQTKLDLQREVVRNERRQDYENRPYGAAELVLPGAMYPPRHPYSWPVIGSHADLVAASVADVVQFFDEFYAPANATLLIAGDFQPEVARRLVQHYFGWMARRPRPPAPWAPPPDRPVRPEVTLHDRVDLARLYLVWHAPPAAAPEIAEARLLADVLGTGRGSRLYRALVHERHLAQEVEVTLEEQALGSLLVAQITALPGVRDEDLLRATEVELERLAREPVSAQELERAQSQRLTSWAAALESLVQRSALLQQVHALHDDPAALRNEVQRLRQVTPAMLQRRAAALGLAERGRRLTLRVLPGPPLREAEQPPPDQAVRAAAPSAPRVSTAPAPPAYLGKRPALLPQRPFVPPPPAAFRVGDLDVVLVRRPGALIQALLVLPVGSAAAPRPGLARALAALALEGAGPRGGAELAEALERLGARLETEVTPDATLVSLSVMADRIGQAMPLLADVVIRPRLEPASWERVRRERLAELMSRRAEAHYVADQAALAALFGPTHPYGQDPLGTEESLRALSLEELKAFHARAWRPRGAVLVLAGEVEPHQQEAERLAAPLSRWRAGPAEPQIPLLPAVPPSRPRLVLIDRPGAPQSELRLISPSQPQRAPDRAAAEVANLLLGGSFTSRLNQNLRERRGWTYGASSLIVRLQEAGALIVRSAVRSDVTAEAAVEALGELRRLRDKPPRPDELDKGRRGVLHDLLQRCERSESLARLVGEPVRYGLPAETPIQLARKVQQVTPLELLRAARGAIRPDEAVVVVVGDRAVVEAPLRRRLPRLPLELATP
ncbi:MAG: pitrilysin family protein [Myxococcales bacterium]|nr:insulinase family protein [Myxococcota bacterium]MDW8280818.1 pitrilysin family protein [Myxococcales bacterium]